MTTIEYLDIVDLSPKELNYLITNAVNNENILFLLRILPGRFSFIINNEQIRIDERVLQKYQALAITQIVSMFKFDYTKTSVSAHPLRADIIFKKIRNQSPLFLNNYLRRLTEWLGLKPDSAIFNEWQKVRSNALNEEKAPTKMKDLQNLGLAIFSCETVILPLPIIFCLFCKSRAVTPEELSDLLHRVRFELLNNFDQDSNVMLYREILASLLNPNDSTENHKIEIRKSRGELVDLLACNSFFTIDQLTVDAITYSLKTIFSIDGKLYKQKFYSIHGLLWNSILKAHEELKVIEQSIPRNPIYCDESDWISSCHLLSPNLNNIATAFTVLTELEKALGVDRYLGSKVVSNDIEFIHKRVETIEQKIQTNLDQPIDVFLRKWNLTEISKIVQNLFGISTDGKLSNYFPSDKQRVILLVVDALGYSQLKWSLSTVSQHVVSPLSSNIFRWLIEKGYSNDNYLLSSNLVSVTGGCLPTIYTGALPKETGIIGSHGYINGYEFNFMKGEAGWTKSLSPKDAENIFITNTNDKLIPLCDLVKKLGINVSIVHGGSATFSPFTNLTYGKTAKDSQKMKKLGQPERIFSEAIEVIRQWSNKREKELLMMYYPSVDSSGHACGPYTVFQAAELSKLNFLFTHFLVELLRNNKELADGKTCILITADHGMYESSRQIVSEKTIRSVDQKLKNVKIIYENRSCYIYGVLEQDLEEIKTKLSSSFSCTKIPIKVYNKNDDIVRSLVYDPSSPYSNNCPDILLQFYGPGIFYHKENLETYKYLFGAHGGQSVEELFVPLFFFTLTSELASEIEKFYS